MLAGSLSRHAGRCASREDGQSGKDRLDAGAPYPLGCKLRKAEKDPGYGHEHCAAQEAPSRSCRTKARFTSSNAVSISRFLERKNPPSAKTTIRPLPTG